MKSSNLLTSDLQPVADNELAFGLRAARALGACGDRVVTEREAARIIVRETGLSKWHRRLELIDRVVMTLVASAETLAEMPGTAQVVYLLGAIGDTAHPRAFVDWSDDVANSEIESIRERFATLFRPDDPVWRFIRR